MSAELNRLLLAEWFVVAERRDLVIYHYTTAAGLIGILQSNSIRGTNAAFLNDTAEISYGVAICTGVIDTMSSEGRVGPDFLDQVARIFAFESAPTEVFITSFTTLDDVLGQWRGYGSEAGRYSIGFQPSQFSERDALRLPQPVDYEAESQKGKVRKAINIAWDHVATSRDGHATRFEVISSLGLYLRRLACLFKHPGFSDEQEWRSVESYGEMDSVQHLVFEPISGVPRPHMTMLEGSRGSRYLPIVDVRVGAANRQDVVVSAVSLLLRRTGYAQVTVTKSRIPLAP